MTIFRGSGSAGYGAIADTPASNVSVADAAGILTATNVEDALAEIRTTAIASNSSSQALSNKTINLANNTIAGTIAQFNTALSDGDFATLAGTETLTNKTISADSNTISGIAVSSFVLSDASGNIDGTVAQKAIPVGVVVGTTDTQTLSGKSISLTSNTITGTTAEFNAALTDGDFTTLAGAETLTNKTISADSNTLSGIAASSFVLSNASGNIDGAAAQKAIPAGVVVGTTDTQTLTNKTLTQPTLVLKQGVSAAPTAEGDIQWDTDNDQLKIGDSVGTKTISPDDVSATLTNKTISVDNNTLSGIAASSFVLSNASGNIDGAAAQKAIPTGTVVGTTDSQTLTNKTLSTSSVWNGDVIGVTYGGTGSSSTPTNGQILIGNGTNYSVSTITAGTGISITNGSGTITIDNTATGLSYFTEARNIAAPNATTPAHSIVVSGIETNIDAVFSPKGTGSILAQVPDNTSTGGDKRGNNAIDFQLVRAISSEVASGQGSVISGGESNTANGRYSVIPGGTQATTRGLYGRYSYSSGQFSTLGDAQLGSHPLRLATTDATVSILTANGSATPDATNVSVLPANTAYTAVAHVTARNTSTGDMASWKIEGAVKRGANAAATALVGTPAITTIAKDAGASAWVVVMVANTTRGSVEIQVTGVAATTIHWMCKLDTVEVG